jgi:hypothetical protein
MKFSRYLVLFLFTHTLLSAEEDAKKTFHENGNVKDSFKTIVRPDGKKGGMMKNFYPDGTMKLEMPIVEAGGELGYAPEGVVKAYYPNGKIESSVGWKRGKRNGPFALYYQDGTLRERGEFTEDISKTAERFSRSHKKLGHEPCLVVDTDKSRVILSEEVVLHADNYHDTGAHLGWVFGYRLVEKEWKQVIKRSRGDTINSRESKAIPLDTKGLAPGEWQFAVTSSVRGPEFFTEARSATIKIEPAATSDGEKPPK